MSPGHRFLVLVVAMLAVAAVAHAEVRGAWVYDPRTQDADKTARRLADAGFTDLFVRLSSGGAAYYPSKVMPTASRSGDQAKRWADAAHRHGLRIHAWHVCFMMHNAPQSEMTKVINRGEAMMDYKGRVLRPSYKAVVRSPAAAGTLAFEKAAMVELATRYDLDGVQFDYIRYPVYSADYSPAARRRFEADTGQKVKSWPWQVWKGSLAGEYGRWKIDVITQLVGEVSAAVRDASDVKISAAVWSNPTVGRDEYGQDWPSWVRKGYLDFVCPMSYTKVDSNLRKWTGMQIAAVDGRVPIYPGLGAYMLKTPSQLNSQINIVRQAGLPGYVLYNADNRTLHEFLPHIKN